MFIKNNWPLIIYEDSEYSQMIKEIRDNKTNKNKYGEKIKTIGK